VGLVHCSSNMTKYIQFVCNCCTCHCGILKSIKKCNMQGSAAVSGFITEFDPEKCTTCGDCVDRCQIEALIIQGDDLVHKDSLCIGCGLCSSVCPTGALQLITRENAPVPPRDWQEINTRLNSSDQVSSYFKDESPKQFGNWIKPLVINTRCLTCCVKIKCYRKGDHCVINPVT